MPPGCPQTRTRARAHSHTRRQPPPPSPCQAPAPNGWCHGAPSSARGIQPLAEPTALETRRRLAAVSPRPGWDRARPGLARLAPLGLCVSSRLGGAADFPGLSRWFPAPFPPGLGRSRAPPLPLSPSPSRQGLPLPRAGAAPSDEVPLPGLRVFSARVPAPSLPPSPRLEDVSPGGLGRGPGRGRVVPVAAETTRRRWRPGSERWRGARGRRGRGAARPTPQPGRPAGPGLARPGAARLAGTCLSLF